MDVTMTTASAAFALSEVQLFRVRTFFVVTPCLVGDILLGITVRLMTTHIQQHYLAPHWRCRYAVYLETWDCLGACSVPELVIVIFGLFLHICSLYVHFFSVWFLLLSVYHRLLWAHHARPWLRCWGCSLCAIEGVCIARTYCGHYVVAREMSIGLGNHTTLSFWGIF